MNAEDLTHDEIAEALVERQRGKARRRTVLGAAAVVMIVGLTVATTLAVQALTKEDQRADRNAGIAGSYAEQLESEGIEPSIDPSQIEGETDDPEIQDLEIDDPDPNDADPNDPDPNDPEPNDPERQEREQDNPERQNPENDDPEVDDPDLDDPDPDDPETQDPEVDDPEPNDPQDPAQSLTLTFPINLFPFTLMVCNLDDGADPDNPTYTCTVA